MAIKDTSLDTHFCITQEMIEAREQHDKEAQAKIDELVQKDKEFKNMEYDVLSRIHSYIPYGVGIQPANTEAYIDNIAGHFSRHDPAKINGYKPILTQPVKKPKWFDRVLNNLATMENVNLDGTKVVPPLLMTVRYYRDIYKYRKVFSGGRLMFQLEYTLEIVEDIWTYILWHEFKRVNPNTNIIFNWVHQPTDDFVDGYNAYQDVFTGSGSIQFDFAIFQLNNYYNRLKILHKLYALTIRIYPVLRNYPKYERQALAADTRRMLIKLHALIQEGASCKSIRKQKYQQAIGLAHELNMALKLAEEQGYVGINFGINMRLAIGEIINMLRSLLQTEASGTKQGGISMRIVDEAVK